MDLTWCEKGDEWAADYNNVRAVVPKVDLGGWYTWEILSWDPVGNVYRPFRDGLELSLEGAREAAEKELGEFVDDLRKVYNRAERGSLLRDASDPHMIWAKTLLGGQGG